MNPFYFALSLFIAYLSGLILTLVFLKYFGEKIGITFNNKDPFFESTNSSIYENIWRDKVSAYTSLSIIWPIYISLLIFISSCFYFVFFLDYFILSPAYNLLKKLTKYFIEN